MVLRCACGAVIRRRKDARNPLRCIACSIAAMVAYDLAAATPGSPEHALAVANGRKGGRPRKIRDSADQLPLPGL